jgi:outer membrane protein insertion porin family
MRRALLFLLIFIAVPLFAQEDEWYVGQAIRDVRFVGLANITEAELRPIVEPYIGQPFSDRNFLELQRRIYALDYFTSVLPEAVRPEAGEGVIIRFTVEERATVSEIRFVGNRRIRTADLLNEILLSTGDMITLARRRADERAIADLYLRRGFPDVTVSSRIDEREQDARARHVVVFTISEGRQVTVREINFSGNTFASASTLRGRMETKAQNIFNPGVFQDRVLEEDRLRIEQYYRERGYIDAKVVDIIQETERDEEAERSQYTFGGIEFHGNEIFEDEELRGLVRLRDGAVLNASRLEEGLAQVQDRYYQHGYIFNQFSIDEARDEQALSIEFVMEIVEQPQAHIENIIIRGNDKTADEVILREIPLQVGDVFSVSRIREGIQNLHNLQYFSAINPETPQGSVDGLMDLVINVEEAQTADITFGVAFGGHTEFPISAQVGWTDRNFQGLGQTFGFQIQASPIDQLLSVHFLERWLGGQRWSLGADISINRSVRRNIPQDILSPVYGEGDRNAVPDPFLGHYVFARATEYPAGSGVTYEAGYLFPHEVTSDLIAQYGLVTDYEFAGGRPAIPEQYLMQYTEWNIGLGVNTGYRFRTGLGMLSVGTGVRSSLNFIGYDPLQYRPFDPVLRRNLHEWQLVNRLSLTSALDRRRGHILAPSSGYHFSQGVTFVGGFLFGDRNFIRTDSKAEGYATLWEVPVFDNWSWKTVLGAHTGISFIFPTFWVPPRYADIEGPIAGPELLATNQMFIARGWPPVTGGQALWSNTLELLSPIAEQIVWSELFMDAVALWDHPADIGTRGIQNMLFTIGGGLRFTIPQFPIRLYLTKRFRIDETGAVEWQEGGLFNFRDRPGGGLDFVFAIGADLF